MAEWELLTETAGVYRTASCPVHEDALRLAEFFRCKPDDRVLDVGTGNGILSIYACSLHGGIYTGIDTDAEALSLAKEGAIRNGQNIRFLSLSAEEAPSSFGHGSFERILMNPPYYTSGEIGRNAAARHAHETLLGEWISVSFLLLKNGGTLCLCYPAEQLAELFSVLEKNRLAPKRLQLLYAGEKARLALVEAKKLGKPGLVIAKG